MKQQTAFNKAIATLARLNEIQQTTNANTNFYDAAFYAYDITIKYFISKNAQIKLPSGFKLYPSNPNDSHLVYIKIFKFKK